MSEESPRAKKLRDEMAKLAKNFKDNGGDPRTFLKKMDEFTHEYYRARHPELTG